MRRQMMMIVDFADRTQHVPFHHHTVDLLGKVLLFDDEALSLIESMMEVVSQQRRCFWIL